MKFTITVACAALLAAGYLIPGRNPLLLGLVLGLAGVLFVLGVKQWKDNA